MDNEKTPDTATTTKPTDAAATTEAAAPAEVAKGPDLISIDKFFKTELKVAEILEVERVPNADRLLKMQISLGGDERRQLVAGIAASYEPEQLIGKRIIVVANLKPARIRGVESQGMLLAADLDGRPIVATFDEKIPAGTKVR